MPGAWSVVPLIIGKSPSPVTKSTTAFSTGVEASTSAVVIVVVLPASSVAEASTTDKPITLTARPNSSQSPFASVVTSYVKSSKSPASSRVTVTVLPSPKSDVPDKETN